MRSVVWHRARVGSLYCWSTSRTGPRRTYYVYRAGPNWARHTLGRNYRLLAITTHNSLREAKNV